MIKIIAHFITSGKDTLIIHCTVTDAQDIPRLPSKMNTLYSIVQVNWNLESRFPKLIKDVYH